MEPVSLSSAHLTVKFKKQGAELCSVKNKTGTEFIWQGNPDVWPRHAPVLFPIVGRLANNKYNENGVDFELGQHGFARDMVFNLVEQTDDSCCFELQANESSKKNYPFDFNLKIGYQLNGSILTTTYKIYNPSSAMLPFSIGAHPGFRCPLLNHETFEDYYIRFEGNNYELSLLSNGLRTGQKKTLLLTNKTLDLNPELFNNDALVFENRQINTISLCSKKSAHCITLSSVNWPYFGIWTKRGCTEFICLEPWHGIADLESANGELQSKEGLHWLAPKSEFSAFFSLEFN